MKTKPPKIHVHTLGCSKNDVDSEVLLAQCRANQFGISDKAEGSDVLVINTCGFIESAKQESINHILDGVRLKESGQVSQLLVMGCLSERYADALRTDIPEVDQYFGSNNLPEILHAMGGEYKYELLGERSLTTPQHFAYLKISEGCDNPCSFCAIPLMRGGHRTKPMDELVTEATLLHQKGVKELILIGQDLTYYGLDLYGSRKLDELLLRLSDIGFTWIRLLYAYPAKFPLHILPVIRERENICNYLDMPLQHISTNVLKSMRRGVTEKRLRELLGIIKEEVPGIRLRTTFIIGYPNETRDDFEALLQFMHDIRFNRVGVFPYSQEDDTTAFPLGDPIPKKEKMRRVKAVMDLQEEISLDHNMMLLGKQLPVLIDRIEGGVAYGRTEYDCPEVDNEFVVQGASDGFDTRELRAGHFYTAEITDVEPHDMFGIITGRLD
ncbi:SSU ribosomal protein S12P methylthiotransferase [Cyclonatronum proteinivorum]|uniref:Ribosomal protein uS12 methylthiotransferase RimO n=1 Tax=Cyclonatronum proteinivorum TaxID=1457365 RepID=A0A345UJ44_9BACT|nr:30S ribosomal protein S12 methylthiotransferase RimO [Cyclonatronum proteinivorum]AXJ00496.1 SSU ribosomal protein S12P methylthiotransferase [Cyclonatronum proteinivorum]